MEVKFLNDKANIEGLTFRQLALIEALLHEASEGGGWQIDIDDYEEIMKGFGSLNIKDVFNLEEEKRQINESVRKIMQKDKVESFREQFLMIKECKDERIRNKQLGVLMTEMENAFNIPWMRDEEYNRANPVVIRLYQDISNAKLTKY